MLALKPGVIQWKNAKFPPCSLFSNCLEPVLSATTRTERRARVNILKQVKAGGRWKLLSIPRDRGGHPDWKALPEGRYFVEWHERGKRRRAAGVTVAEALEVARHKRHALEGKALGIPAYTTAYGDAPRTPLHLAVERYLNVVEGLKKPNTLRKYRAVLNRFLEFFPEKTTAQNITGDDLNQFLVYLKKKRGLDNNTVIHDMIVVAQFLKKQGRAGLTREVDLPEKMATVPEEYNDEELKKFFASCNQEERTQFLTYLLTGFREQEIVHLFWSDINFSLHTVRVTAKPELGFSTPSAGRSTKCRFPIISSNSCGTTRG